MASCARELLLCYLVLVTGYKQIVSAIGDVHTPDVDNRLIYDHEGAPSADDAASIDFVLSEASLVTPLAGGEAVEKDNEVWEVWDLSNPDPPELPSRRTLEVAPLAPPTKPTVKPSTKTTTTKPPPPLPVVSAPLDALFDFALGAVRYELIANHSTEEPVPNFKQEFKARVGPFKVHGHFDASEGTAGDLSSLYRDGPVALSNEPGGVLVLNVAAGLRTLRVRYHHYSARAGPIRVSGSLEAEASPAALRAQLELRPPCGLRLRSLRVAALGPLHVKASGLGVLRRLLPLIQRWLDKRLRGDVEKAVVTHLSALVDQQLKRFSC